MTCLDPAISKALAVDETQLSISSSRPGFSTTFTVETRDGARYFIKQSPSRAMIYGESKSYELMSEACLGFCPAVVAVGQCTDESYFSVTTCLDFGAVNETSLARNLARLHAHTTDEGYGFDVETCCADTVQDNAWNKSWLDFFIERRLRPISTLSPNGKDARLEELVDEACTSVVPRLLGNLDICPALIHGDLWSGNERSGYVFDACAMYAHSEFELSIMVMFGGFTRVLEEYHALKPKDEPSAEYEDRIALYMCYHQLNHSGTGQGAGYASSAKKTLQNLLDKYR